jgi:asparagine synthetase B (glutamine-hydrolysing)
VTVRLFDISREEADAALALLGRHLDPAIEIAVPALAARGPDDDGSVMIITDADDVFWIFDDRVVHIVDLGGGRGERAEFVDGAEVLPRIIAAGTTG